MNHVINAVIAGLLGSALHGVASRHLLLLTLRARRSGRRITIPVGYEEVGADRLKVTVGLALPLALPLTAPSTAEARS